jgi:nitrate/nitrite transporter NarK
VCLLGDVCIHTRTLGDIIAACGALGGLLTLLVSKLQRSEMELSAFITIMTATMVAVFVSWAYLADPQKPTLSTSPEHGAQSSA